MSMTIKSTWHGPAVKANERKGAAEGLLAAAEYVLAKSQALVPVAEVEGGKLRDTGKASVDEGALRAAVSYDTDYAVYVHEAMDYQHASGTQAKYLEQPLNESGDEISRLVAEAIKASLGT